MKKVLPFIIITTGIFIVLFPFMREQYEDYRMKQLLDEWVQTAAINETDVDEQRDAENDLETDIQVLDDVFGNVSLEEESAEEGGGNTPPTQEPIGIIEIHKIDLKLPILEEVSQENLKYGAGHLTATSPIGEVGNAAIAAHRAKTYGRLFNRLNELEVGDVITIRKGNQKFEFTVSDKLRVVPDNVSVLKYNNKDKMITLITCDPVKNPTHRIIVYAKM